MSFGLRPWVTDRKWDKIVEDAESPVVTEWHLTGERLTTMDADDHRILLAEFDDRVMFVAMRIDEHPALSKQLSIFGPTITVHRRKVLIGRAYGPITESDYENLCNFAHRKP